MAVSERAWRCPWPGSGNRNAADPPDGQHTHGDAVWFFPRRTAGTPNPQLQILLLPLGFEDLGELLFEKLEMLGLPEEVSEVGRNGIQEMNEFLTVPG